MATTADSSNGVIYDRPDLTLLDTRAMAWEEFPGLKGFYMHRRPGSLHGLEPGPESDTGCLILFWRDAIGNWLDDPNAAEESPDVPYPA